MEKILLLVLLLSGCSWRHKDFTNSVDTNEDTAAPEVTVDPQLLEKFEVKSVPVIPVVTEKPIPEGKDLSKKHTITDAKKNKPAVRDSKKTIPKPIEAKKVIIASEEYPQEIIDINERAKKVWDAYKPNHTIGEKIYLDINYLGMTVGKIMSTNRGKKMINGKEVWHFYSRFKSAPFYSKIYELDDTVDTYVTTDQFLSLRYSLIQRESSQAIDDLELFDRDQLKVFWFYKQKKKDGSIKDKTDEKPIPFYSIDPFSIVFFYQGLPLADGDIYEIPIINKGKILILRSVVEGREKIETDIGNKAAIRVHATTQYSGDQLKSGDIYFWFSNDEKRTFLKARAKINIGSVTADIVSN